MSTNIQDVFSSTWVLACTSPPPPLKVRKETYRFISGNGNILDKIDLTYNINKSFCKPTKS
jgi:hypothetical protein